MWRTYGARHTHSFDAGFELEFGDITTIPQAEAVDIRSMTSGKVLGCVHISGTKNTPLEERMVFKNKWYVGSEHGLVHDGMQADGSLEVRIDWKVRACDTARPRAKNAFNIPSFDAPTAPRTHTLLPHAHSHGCGLLLTLIVTHSLKTSGASSVSSR